MNGVLVQIPMSEVPLDPGIFFFSPLSPLISSPFPSFSVLLHSPLPALQIPPSFSPSLSHTAPRNTGSVPGPTLSIDCSELRVTSFHQIAPSAGGKEEWVSEQHLVTGSPTESHIG